MNVMLGVTMQLMIACRVNRDRISFQGDFYHVNKKESKQNTLTELSILVVIICSLNFLDNEHTGGGGGGGTQ